MPMTPSPKEVIVKSFAFLKPETNFYLTSITYGIGVSILTLAIPISVQSLVNTVTFGFLYQPLVVLSIVLLAVLLFSSTLNALQDYTVEMFQRQFYARATSNIALKLLRAEVRVLQAINGPEVVNRYFDVMTVQKSMTTLVTGGISVMLQTFVGLLLLAFYHPYFLVFDILLVLMLCPVWIFFYKGAVQSAIKESKAKYMVAGWLQEIARLNLFFKSSSKRNLALNNSNDHIENYLGERKKHFRFVFMQMIALLLIYATMSALILGLGGLLVIKGQLTMGQLVAAELVVTVILSNFSKSGKYLEAFYDLVAAIDKISFFDGIQPETVDESKEKQVPNTWDLNFHKVGFRTKHEEFQFNYKFEFGQSYFVRSRFYSTKLIFQDYLECIEAPRKGNISLGNLSFRDLTPHNVRDWIYVVSRPRVLHESIFYNLTLEAKNISKNEVLEALEIVDLSHVDEMFSEALETTMLPSGYPLWPSQLVRFEIARAILAKPKILILTEVFDQVENQRRMRILKYLMKKNMTLIIFSQKKTTTLDFHRYLYFSPEKISEFTNSADYFQHIEKVDEL